MDAVRIPGLTPSSLRWRMRLSLPVLTFILVVVAFAARLIDLNGRPLWLDEAYSAWFSSRSWHVLWTEVPTYEPHPPFYYSLLKCWRALTGGSAVSLRSFSVLLGVAAVPVVIASSAELERQRPSGQPLLRAGIAGFLTACSPMLVLLGQEARPYPLLIFAYSLAVLGVLRLIREFADGPGDWFSWAMVVAGTELALWAHGLGLLYALCLAGALAPAWLRRPITISSLMRGIASAAAVALLYLPCLLMILSRAKDWGGSGWLTWKPSMMLQLISLYSIPVEVLTIGSAVAALVMALLLKRTVQDAASGPGWSSDRALMLMWWGPPILSIAISQFAIPVFLTRTLAASLVPAYLSLSGALARIPKQQERTILAAALVITMLPSSVQIALRPAAEEWDGVRAYLDQNIRPGDQAWLYPNDSALPLVEAGERAPLRGIPGDYPAIGMKGPIRAGSPAVVSVTHAQAAKLASDPAIGNVPTIWLVTRQSAIFDPHNDMPSALARVRRPGVLQKWGYIEVRPYYRR